MTLDYIAAEYFVDAICASRDNCINFDYVMFLTKLIGKHVSPDIGKFLDEKSNTDFLYIFKEFPDIFTIEKNRVGLTEAFLSLYHHDECPVSKKNYAVNCYVENCVIDYFKKILTYGPKPFLDLFNALMNDNTQKYMKYYIHFTVSDALKFFLGHSNHFIVNNDLVFLNNLSVQSYSVANNQNNMEHREIFEISVYFLVSCFKSLHYLQLKQCLSYVQGSTKRILDQMSLVRQRELFAFLPFTSLDAFGFVTLETSELSIALPDVMKFILLTVCILAFQKVMLVSDLFAVFSDKLLPASNHFTKNFLGQLVDFIRAYPQYFVLSDSGYVSLLPEFIMPVRSLQTFLECRSDFHTIVKNIKTTDKDQVSYVPSTIKDVHSPSCTTTNLSKNKTEIVNQVEELQNIDSLAALTNLCMSGLSETVNDRLKQSLCYLSKYFYPLDKKCAMQTLLHVVNDVRISFCSSANKYEFISVCCDVIKCLSKKFHENVTDIVNDLLCEKEKNLLFVIYMLIDNERMHFLTLIETMKACKINNTLVNSSVSDQILFFQTLNSYIDVYNDGQITFSPSFYPIISLLDSYSELFSESEPTEIILPNTIKESTSKMISEERKTSFSKILLNKSGSLPKALSCATSVNPSDSKSFSKAFEDEDETSFTNISSTFPDHIFKIFSYSARLVRKYYEYAGAIHILKSTLISFADVFNFFNSLPFSDQHVFLEQCFEFLTKETYYFISSSEKEKEILFITFILRHGSVHYRKIVQDLSTCGCEKLSALVEDAQYQYFKMSGYFVITSDGYVNLSSAFNHIDALVNAAVHHLLKTQSLSETSIHRSTNSYKIASKQHVLENTMEKDNLQISLNNTSCSIQNNQNLNMTSQDKVQETINIKVKSEFINRTPPQTNIDSLSTDYKNDISYHAYIEKTINELLCSAKSNSCNKLNLTESKNSENKLQHGHLLSEIPDIKMNSTAELENEYTIIPADIKVPVTAPYQNFELYEKS